MVFSQSSEGFQNLCGYTRQVSRAVHNCYDLRIYLDDTRNKSSNANFVVYACSLPAVTVTSFNNNNKSSYKFGQRKKSH